MVIKVSSTKSCKCKGRFLLTQNYWDVTVWVDKKYLRLPPSYQIIKDDALVREQNLVTIFLSDCLGQVKDKCVNKDGLKACFEAFCRVAHKEESLSFLTLEETLKEYLKLEPKQCYLNMLPQAMYGNHQRGDHSILMMSHVIGSELGATVLLAGSHPLLVKTLSELLPFSFAQILHRLKSSSCFKPSANAQQHVMDILEKKQKFLAAAAEEVVLTTANKMATESPWEFVFKDIIGKKLGIYGTESKLKTYKEMGYMSKTPQTPRNAIYIYEVLKTDSSRNGNMYMGLKKLKLSNLLKKLDHFITSDKRWSDALTYLENNGVIKCEAVQGDTNVFLLHNWKAEVDATIGVETILKRHQTNPLKWDVDFNSPDFAHIREDRDQMKASHLICSLPITVMSGRGGCGKTTVVTTLLKHLCDQEESKIQDQKLLDDDEWDESLASSPPPTQPDTSSTATQPSLGKVSEGLTEYPVAETREDNLSRQSSKQVKGTKDCLDHTRCCSQESGASLSLTKHQLSGDGHPLSSSQVPDLHVIDPHVPDPSVIDPHVPDPNVIDPHNPDPRVPLLSRKENLQAEVVSHLIKILNHSKPDDCSELQEFKGQILLTAPTGKAARLLGCKARLPSATLHSVIMSWRMHLKESRDRPWKYANVQVLVIDECSLLSVRLFASVMNILLAEADLKKVILLGDFRQLPSIEPGELFKDFYHTLCHVGNGLGFSIDLTHNHRSESELIVHNAARISSMIMPTFNSERGFTLVNIAGGDNDRDEAIRHLLKTVPALKSDVDSQFVTFRNAHCRAVNELCCKHYNNHPIKDVKLDFQIGDKICLGKNAYVTNHCRLIISQYLKDSPQLQEAFNAAKQTLGRNNESGAGKAQQEANGNKSYLDSSTVADLVTGDDAVFDKTVNRLREVEAEEKNEAERSRQERLERAKKKEKEWANKRTADERLFGESKEKLCNGEVFFIMDEIVKFDDDKKPVKYLVISDRDPELPRVVCIPMKQLRRECHMKHSWVRTIHTYQGSESDTVVYVLGQAIPQNWQHVYTAITRGKKAVYVVGQFTELFVAVNRREFPRFSWLRQRLRAMIKENFDFIMSCLEAANHSYQETVCDDSLSLTDEFSESMLQLLDDSDAINSHTENITDRQKMDNTLDDWLSSSQTLQETYLSLMPDDSCISARVSPPQSPAVSSQQPLHEMSPHKKPCPENQQTSPGLVVTFTNSLNINTETDHESPLPRKVPDVRRKL